jgi:hypothetical protein
MANIIRCVLPDGVHRFKPFTVADYRDFLLIRNDLQHKSYEEQKKVLNEMLADYFGDYPETLRPYMFMKVFTGSIGKTKIPVMFTCPTCEKQKQVLFDLSQPDLVEPTITVAGIDVAFKYPEKEYDDKAAMIYDCIKAIKYNDKWYDWKELSEDNQIQVIEAIDFTTFEKVYTQLTPMRFELKMKCCEIRTNIYEDILSVFKLLINPDEIFSFYQINHTLVKSSYDLGSIMNMIPIERSIALSLVEKDNKK